MQNGHSFLSGRFFFARGQIELAALEARMAMAWEPSQRLGEDGNQPGSGKWKVRVPHRAHLPLLRAGNSKQPWQDK